MADKLKPWRDELLKRLDEVCSRDGRVPRHVAENLVAGSAWWESHPSGPVRAPRHADRIDGSEKSWSVEFGANSFLVSAAVQGCCQCIRQWIQQQQALPVPVKSWERLAGELQAVVHGSVANYRGDTYSGYGHGTQGKLIFGAQAIYVNDFVGGIAGYLKTPALHTFQKRGLTPPTPSAPRTKGKTKVPLIPGRVICPHCRSEVNASKLDSHIRERCPKRPTDEREVIIDKKAPSKDATDCPPTPQHHGITICPWCKGAVSEANLDSHQMKRCPNRIGAKRTGGKQKLPQVVAPKVLLPVQLPPGIEICTQCRGAVRSKHMAKHKAMLCPNRPRAKDDAP